VVGIGPDADGEGVGAGRAVADGEASHDVATAHQAVVRQVEGVGDNRVGGVVGEEAGQGGSAFKGVEDAPVGALDFADVGNLAGIGVSQAGLELAQVQRAVGIAVLRVFAGVRNAVGVAIDREAVAQVAGVGDAVGVAVGDGFLRIGRAVGVAILADVGNAVG